MLSTARFSSTGLNLEEAQNLDLSEESQKKSAERYEYRSAARELADQLKSEGRSQAEINSFLFMANIGTYIGAHNRAGISASEWLRKIVFKAAQTGNMQEMAELFQAAALRGNADPNTAGERGQMRDGNVPHAEGFLEWAGLGGTRLYADYEFLYGRHSKYFKDQEHARAAVELVLSNPERVQDINGNMSFVAADEETGEIYRIEVEPKVKRKDNHVRSVFRITPEQYEKIKLETPPVLQPSSTEGQTVRKTRTLSSFLRYYSTESENVNPRTEEFSDFLFQASPDTLGPSEIFDEYGAWTEKGAVAWYGKLVKAAERFAERTKQSGLVLDEAGLIAAAETALRNAAKGYNPEAGQFEAYAGKAVKNAFISAARSAGRRNVATASLQEETGTGGDAQTLEDRIADPDAASADEIMAEAETAERLAAALETLTEKERQVWDMAQADRGRGYITRIAETLGVSKTNVSKLYRKAEAKMKAAAADPDAVKQKTAEPAVSETVTAAQTAEPVSETAAPEQTVGKKVPYIPSDAKGMFRETPDFGGMIFLFENADATTVVHEMAHAAMETMRRMIAAGVADERMESDFAALEEWAKLDPASAAKQYAAYTQRMEKFAEGIRYFRNIPV